MHLMFSAESSGIGATVWTAGRFLLVAPFTKLDDEEEEEDPESTAPVPQKIQVLIQSEKIQLLETFNIAHLINLFLSKEIMLFTLKQLKTFNVTIIQIITLF